MSLAEKVSKLPFIKSSNDDLVTWRDAEKVPPPLQTQVLCEGVVRMGDYNGTDCPGYFVAKRKRVGKDANVFESQFGFAISGKITEVSKWRPIEPLEKVSEN